MIGSGSTQEDRNKRVERRKSSEGAFAKHRT